MRARLALLCAIFLFLIFPNLASVPSLAQTTSSAQAGKTSSTPAQAVPAGSSVGGDSGVEAAPGNESDDNDSADIPAFVRGRISEKDYLRMREQHLGIQRGVNDLARDPQARSRAVRAMRAQENALRKKTLSSTSITPALGSGPTWTPLGPAPIPNGQVQSGSEIPVSGRVTAIAVDPTDSTGNTLYVGAASGGLYRSLDGGTTWTPLMDSALSLSIGAITIDPLDHNTIFVGTGEGNFSLDSFFGVGVYVITNATSATPVLSGPFNSNGSSDIFTGRAITRILVNPADDTKILVSTSSGFSGASGEIFSSLPTRGVYLSTNARSATPTFTRLTIQPTANQPVTDMAMDPNNANMVVINVFGQAGTEGGIWVSPSTVWSGTGTWTQTNQTGQGVNAKLSVNRSGSTTSFFAGLDQRVTCNAKSVHGTLFKSDPTATTWTEITGAEGFCGGQCFYDIAVAVDPTNVSKILLGGSADSSVSSTCSTNALVKSSDGSTFARSDAQLHADFHAIAIFSGNPSIVYAGNDGGIFRSNDGGATWASLNTVGFNATQFESIAVHPSDPNFTIGGTQDNGTPMLQPGGSWNRVDFGDGGFSAIDSNATDNVNVVMYHTYFNQTNNLIGFAEIENGVNASEGNWNFFGCDTTDGNGITCADITLFYAPLTLGPGSPNTVYFGTDKLYRSINKGVTNTAVSQVLVPNSPISAIGISPQDDNVRIVGMGPDDASGVESGKVFATTSGSSTLTDVTGPWDAKYIARAVIDPNSKFTAYITLDGYGTPNHVWKTTNLNAATVTWNAASTGIPDVPVNALIVDPANSNNVYAGTDIGVYFSADAGGTWNPYGQGLPRVPVFDMKFAPGGRIRLATHGRGMWETAKSGLTDDVTNLVVSPAHTTTLTTVTFTATVSGSSPTPTGTVAFFVGTPSSGATSSGGPPVALTSGVATLSTTAIAAGVFNVTAVYSGDGTYRGSTSSVAQLTINSITSKTSLLVNPGTTDAFGTPLTLVAHIDTAGSTTAPTGTMTFLDGASSLGTVSVNSTAASFQTSSLAGGSHNITASYSGDGNYSASVSTVVAVTITTAAPDYSVSIPSGSATIHAGAPATYTINVSALNGFTGVVNFNCTTGVPSLANCAFNPTAVTNNGSTTLTISTTAPTSAPKSPNLSARMATGGLLGLGLVLAGSFAVKKRRHSLLLLVIALAMAAALVSCGGGGTPVTHNPGTPPGTYTVTVTATSGATTHSSTVTLTVQ
jgi:hypothetical protein